ncbi:MAG: NADH:ubiquinone reductase (Na(+)-transporting) subunit D [Desulfobulbaceae bacterium]|nr:NADH:ubiquinone reductase (Na(+)-transporting) subunit D [Desulfofustis sp.]NNK57915.1 NADH:ubiquinone reductase (Na(+)-transporting) subunit D [Desulfofustis sp.]RZW19409.1 MAG: NADH:ubiquinone reductase (Na(+)-transporting) subunit D [Desulfobulbaceae bacterium]
MNLKEIFGKKGAKVIKNGVWREHPISSATLGICSALAISNKVENAIAMSAGVIFVLIITAIIISVLRKIIPSRVRIIIYMITIAAGVTIVDLVLKAYFPTISEAMGPYVPLIITNCMIMGRAEAFFVQNPPKLSLIDALANGLAYTYTLMAIAIFREIFAFGTLLGVRVTPSGWVDWVVLAAPAGAFFVLGVFLWITRTAAGVEPPKSS